MEPTPFSDIVIGGLAPDGGLTLPESYPKFSEQGIVRLGESDYQVLATEIINRFAGDIPLDDLERLVRKTYTKEKFGIPEITPLISLEDDIHLLDLSTGPTLAFKDIALQFLGNLFEYVLDKKW